MCVFYRQRPAKQENIPRLVWRRVKRATSPSSNQTSAKNPACSAQAPRSHSPRARNPCRTAEVSGCRCYRLSNLFSTSASSRVPSLFPKRQRCRSCEADTETPLKCTSPFQIATSSILRFATSSTGHENRITDFGAILDKKKVEDRALVRL